MDEIGSGAAAVLASTEDRYANATNTATITAKQQQQQDRARTEPVLSWF